MRRTGVAIAVQQIEMVSLSVAAPIRGSRDEVVAAVSVVAPVEGGAQPYVPVMVTTARGISRALARSASR